MRTLHDEFTNAIQLLRRSEQLFDAHREKFESVRREVQKLADEFEGIILHLSTVSDPERLFRFRSLRDFCPSRF